MLYLPPLLTVFTCSLISARKNQALASIALIDFQDHLAKPIRAFEPHFRPKALEMYRMEASIAIHEIDDLIAILAVKWNSLN